MNRHAIRLSILLTAAALLTAGFASPVAAASVQQAATLIQSAASFAQTAPQRIALVDTGKVFSDSRQGKAALADLQTFQDQKRAELGKLVEEIKSLQQRITDGQLSLSEDKLTELRTSIEQKGTDLRRRQEDANREADRRRNAALERINQQVMPVIQQIAKEKGYSFIFRKFESGLVFADDSADITADVIARLDAASR